MKKTLVITVCEGSVVRTLLRSAFWRELTAAPEARIVLVAPAGKVEEYKKEFGSGQVVVEGLPLYGMSRGEKFLSFLMRNGYYSGTNVIMQHRTYAIGESRLPPLPKQAVARILGVLPVARRLLRRLELRIAPSPAVAKLFDTYKPDLVCSTVLLDEPIDVPVMREARRRGVPTAGMVRSWDNLTTYGLLRVPPDRFFAYNEFMRERAVALHDLPARTVEVVGTPAFDADAHPERALNREEYCKRLGIDPAKRIILYAAVGDYIFRHEGEVADVFEKLIEEGKLPEDCVVVFRAHPAFTSPLERIAGMRHVVPESTPEPVSSLCHAAVVVTAGSTMMLEAALFDKPVITVAFDGLTKEEYWFSIGRFHDHGVHILAALKVGAIAVAHSAEELAEAVCQGLAEPAARGAERAKLVERFVGPNRGNAAETLGRLVHDMLVSG